MLRDHWVEHGEVRLHQLVNDGDRGHVPLVYVPGSLGSAEDARDELHRLAPRTCAAVSPRGTGRSSAPDRGYAFEDAVSDLNRVLLALDLPPYCLMAFSRGVPVALGHAVQRPRRVSGMILLDHPARATTYPQRWLTKALPYARARGIPEHVVRRMQHESGEIELWSALRALTCPVLVLKGGQSAALTEEDVERYRSSLARVRVVRFEDAGHEVFRPDYERFMREVEGFLAELDAAMPDAGR